MNTRNCTVRSLMTFLIREDYWFKGATIDRDLPPQYVNCRSENRDAPCHQQALDIISNAPKDNYVGVVITTRNVTPIKFRDCGYRITVSDNAAFLDALERDGKYVALALFRNGCNITHEFGMRNNIPPGKQLFSCK